MYVQGVWCEVTVEPGRTVVREGAYETASFMSREIAVKLIVSCLKEFVGPT
jgi:hypothetical protein